MNENVNTQVICTHFLPKKIVPDDEFTTCCFF